MGILEIVVIILAVAIVLAVVITSNIRRKQGKTCCSDCSKCSCGCDSAQKIDNNQEKQEESIDKLEE